MRSRTTARRWSTRPPPGRSCRCPPKLTYGQIKSFTRYATRTILLGGGEELVDLTKTNLRELDVE
jgi:hypothetical protein